uniref:Phospholipid-translocating ATPase n=1 Tax=Mycena chlorophos TaxID=658473 RepID=A0ABQ0M004_MYCCL|nr:phospholipid-translocating ATPase [Mycena chlorophos]
MCSSSTSPSFSSSISSPPSPPASSSSRSWSTRHAAASLTHLNTASAFANASFHVDCERPDTNMYRLNGVVFMGSDNTSAPFDLSMTLLAARKRSKVERQMNPQVASNLLPLAVMATACGITDSILEKREYPEGAPWLFDDDTREDNPSFNGLVTCAFALITFQNIVPISLYISSEFVRTCQALFIYFDSEIYYVKRDQPTLARSWNLSDDLGQIEYIFSDKTGTLTQNSMVFRECSIGGKQYTGPGDGPSLPSSIPSTSTDRPSTGGSSTAVVSTGTPPRVPSPSGKNDTKLRFTHAWSLNGFFTVLALCHTVLADINTENGHEEVSYKAQSPDEAALVQAAADSGYVFRGCEQRNGVLVLALQTPSGAEEWCKSSNVLEFTSARKRMSVIVKELGGGGGEDAESGTEMGGWLLLLSKGADNVIFERLKAGAADGGGEGADGGTFRRVCEQRVTDVDVGVQDFPRTRIRSMESAHDSEHAQCARRARAAPTAIKFAGDAPARRVEHPIKQRPLGGNSEEYYFKSDLDHDWEQLSAPAVEELELVGNGYGSNEFRREEGAAGLRQSKMRQSAGSPP